MITGDAMLAERIDEPSVGSMTKEIMFFGGFVAQTGRIHPATPVWERVRMNKPPLTRYRTTNWRFYDASLKKRGSLTAWFDPAMSWEDLTMGGAETELSCRCDPDLPDVEGSVRICLQTDDRLCRTPVPFTRSRLVRPRFHHTQLTNWFQTGNPCPVFAQQSHFLRQIHFVL